MNTTNTIFDKLDSDWCIEQAQWIVKNLPLTESINNSGKFYHTYRCWHLHKSSEVPIIKKMNRMIEDQSKQFKKIYNRSPKTDFFILAYTVDDSKEMCMA